MILFKVARVSAKGGHAHVQVVPVPHSLADKVEEAFVEEGKRIGFEPESDPQAALKALADGKKSYFRVDLPDGRVVMWLIDNAGRSSSLELLEGNFASSSRAVSSGKPVRSWRPMNFPF